jgi:hypothetical protein
LVVPPVAFPSELLPGTFLERGRFTSGNPSRVCRVEIPPSALFACTGPVRTTKSGDRLDNLVEGGYLLLTDDTVT